MCRFFSRAMQAARIAEMVCVHRNDTCLLPMVGCCGSLVLAWWVLCLREAATPPERGLGLRLVLYKSQVVAHAVCPQIPFACRPVCGQVALQECCTKMVCEWSVLTTGRRQWLLCCGTAGPLVQFACVMRDQKVHHCLGHQLDISKVCLGRNMGWVGLTGHVKCAGSGVSEHAGSYSVQQRCKLCGCRQARGRAEGAWAAGGRANRQAVIVRKWACIVGRWAATPNSPVS